MKAAASTRARAGASSPPSQSRIGARKRSWMATFSSGAVVGEVAARSRNWKLWLRASSAWAGAGHHRGDLAREGRRGPIRCSRSGRNEAFSASVNRASLPPK